MIEVPWRKTPSTRRREVLVPETGRPQDVRPIRSENRALLVASIARARRWLDELMTYTGTNTESIAKREGCSVRQVNMTISLAFLAPDLIKAAIDGQLPRPWCDADARSARGVASPKTDARSLGPQPRIQNAYPTSRCCRGERGFRAQRQLGQNPLRARICLCGDHHEVGRARQLRAIWRSPGNLVVRKSAWWAREKSQLCGPAIT